MSGWRSQERGHELVEPPASTGALNVPSATTPLRIAVNSPTLSAASSSARRLRGGVLGEGVAGVGRDDAAPGADEQVGAERALELADLLGDGGLRHPQRVRRGA